MWPDLQNSMLRMTSICKQILEDRVWLELATPALRGLRGKVKDTQLFAPTVQGDGSTLPLGRSRQHTEPKVRESSQVDRLAGQHLRANER